jgi:hypothetical protein
MRRLLGALVLAVGFAIVGTAVAVAAIPDAGGVIHGCYDKMGALRVINAPSASCSTKETAISWNQTGPAGAKGPAGAPGPAGATGAPGVSGYTVVTTEANGTYQSAIAPCPAGETAIGGGVESAYPSGAIAMSAPSWTGSAPPNRPNGWVGRLSTSLPNGSGTDYFLVWALCANVG